MKEVTYDDWQKNPTPRMMWVWNNNPDKAIKRKVIYFSGKFGLYPVISLTEDETVGTRFKHCAEIEKPRRMTNKELSIWIREKPTRELKIGTYVYHNYDYEESEHDLEVTDSLLIRENDGDWKEPLMEDN